MKKSNNPHLEFDNKMKALAWSVYNEKYMPNDCICVSTYNDKITGFYAKAYIMGNKLVISIKGTDITSLTDVWSDIQLAYKKIPSQFQSALKFYNSMRYKYKDLEIVVTGLSLGGSLTQLLCSLTKCEGVTFSAYGVSDFVDNTNHSKDENKNIRNYGNINDYTFGSTIDKHIGQVYVIETNKYETRLRSKQYHLFENMGELIFAEPYDKKKHNKFNEEQKNPSKILLIKDLLSKHFGTKNEKLLREIIALAKEGNIMDDEELESKIKSGEVHVRAYNREDGTHVKEYYRSYPHFA